MPTVAIIDYGSGNLRSVHKALEHVAPEATVRVTREAADLKAASHILLPGVGAFADCMRGLTVIPGMRDALEEEVRGKGKWFLGICVGMQMLMQQGHEHGLHEGLGWIEGEVVKLVPGCESRVASKGAASFGTRNSELGTPLKIPHMGWNELTVASAHPLLKNIASGAHAYFVHSYHARCADAKDVIARTDYGGPVVAAVARGNIMGTQFHPEKSQATGLALLRNFVEI
jgi:glutamine amidotransferase